MSHYFDLIVFSKDHVQNLDFEDTHTPLHICEDFDIMYYPPLYPNHPNYRPWPQNKPNSNRNLKTKS